MGCRQGFSCLLLALFVAGCMETGGPAPQTVPPNGGTTPPANLGVLNVGDQVTVIFSNVSSVAMPQHEERIKEDGNITLQLIGTVKAAGKTVGELQKEIQNAYVPKYYRNLVITVRSEDRFFYVDGEVKLPNRYLYAGEQTVLKAITTAGGFTDYASKTRVVLTRVSGEKITVDAKKAQKDPKYDLPVYPGDRIEVKRRGI